MPITEMEIRRPHLQERKLSTVGGDIKRGSPLAPVKLCAEHFRNVRPKSTSPPSERGNSNEHTPLLGGSSKMSMKALFAESQRANTSRPTPESFDLEAGEQNLVLTPKKMVVGRYYKKPNDEDRDDELVDCIFEQVAWVSAALLAVTFIAVVGWYSIP